MKLATLSAHVTALHAAIQAAREDGYLLGWDFDYGYSYGYSVDHSWVEEVSLSLYRNRRGEDGIMRREEEATVLEAYV